MNIRGPFEVTIHAQPAPADEPAARFSPATLTKRFTGPLEGTSEGVMLSARTTTAGSAGYVALERIEGRVEGRRGSFLCPTPVRTSSPASAER